MSHTIYDAQPATVHGAFAPFAEQTRRECAEVFARHDGDRTVPYVLIVDGEDHVVTCCPLAFCLIREAAVEPVPVIVRPEQFDPATGGYDRGRERRSIAFVDGGGFYVDPRLPEWHQIAHALGELDDAHEGDPIPQRPKRADGGRFRELRFAHRSFEDLAETNTIRDDFPYHAFYDEWDGTTPVATGEIDDDGVPVTEEVPVLSTENLIHDYLGIDALSW